MTKARTITDAEAIRWRLLSYVFHHTGRPLSDRPALNQEESFAWNELHWSGSLRFGGDAADGSEDRWMITPQGRELYYQLRACQVPGCTYLEVRGSREGDYLNGHFLCPTHAASIGANLALDAVAGKAAPPPTYDSGLLTRVEAIPPSPSLEEICRIHNRAKQEVIEWIDAEGIAGRPNSCHLAPAWEKYQTASAALRKAIIEVGLGPK